MITKAEKFRLGVFVITSTSILLTLVAVLAGIRLTESRDYYTIHFDESVSGLEHGAQVKYNGVRVGQVTNMEIDPKTLSQVIVTIAIKKGTPIREDTIAILNVQGITGLKFIEIQGGSSDSPELKPGSQIKADQSVLGALEGKAQDIAVKIELALNRINLLLSDENIKNVGEIISNVNDISKNVNALLGENQEKLNQIIANVEAASQDLKVGMASAKRSVAGIERVVENASPKIDRLTTDASKTFANLRDLSEKLNKVDGLLKEIEVTLAEFNRQFKEADVGKVVSTAQSVLDNANTTVRSLRRMIDASRENIYKSTQSLKNSLVNIEDFSEEIRTNPGVLLKNEPPVEKTPPDE